MDDETHSRKPAAPSSADGAREASLDLRRRADLTPAERDGLRALSAAVYPPEAIAAWPGRALTWAQPEWAVLLKDADGQLLSHAGALLRAGSLDGAPVTIGGIGGVLTHPDARRRGLAARAMGRALDHFREAGADFALLVCEPRLIPTYERLGWSRHAGDVYSRQGQTDTALPFTFNLVMTCALGLSPPGEAAIDLQGPPW